MDPITKFLGDSLKLDQWKFTTAEDSFETSLPGVFAAGDVRADPTKQLGSAVGAGMAELLMVRHFLRVLPWAPPPVIGRPERGWSLPVAAAFPGPTNRRTP